MALTHYACTNCGFWQAYFAPPPDCPVCTDVRNDLPEDGWDFLPAREAEARFTGEVRQISDGFWAARTSPPLGLNGQGWLMRKDGVNVAFEGAPYYTNAMLDEIETLGGVQILAASHAHGYGALWQLQARFDPEVVAIQKDDLRMTKAFKVTLPYDDALELLPGLTLHHVGGHYEGQAVLHDEGAGRLFCGDVFKIDQTEDGRSHAISSHKAFHKDIPLTHGELQRYRDVIAPLDFTEVCTPFEHAPDVGRGACVAALDRALSETPKVRRYALKDLS
ncbi:hypothetical protein [Parvularcula dongshanensis]|uniref:Metallo-beta-lactamase domain-containing protein n=1 Tax=Parvularcula dongshanensis TaxID=1173995 RepID=A0A840I295_9PROT|nr:hypothetical protein [Parvularcula dongshanensis]MBB4658403.1 hypothetical protein [Parvularcula dongshanensis]